MKRRDLASSTIAGKIIPLALFALLFALAPTPAQAQEGGRYIQVPFAGQRPFLLDAHAGFVWQGLGFATGARFGIPVMHNGFIPGLNNAAYVTVGADFYWIRMGGIPGRRGFYGPGLGFPVSLLWEFFFTEHWSAFGELGVNVFLDPWLFEGEGMRAHPGHWILVAVGGRYKFNDVIAITVRLGNPYLCVGATFMF